MWPLPRRRRTPTLPPNPGRPNREAPNHGHGGARPSAASAHPRRPLIRGVRSSAHPLHPLTIRVRGSQAVHSHRTRRTVVTPAPTVTANEAAAATG
jgi:hypothetical protein